MKILTIWAVNITCSETNINTQTCYVKKYHRALTLMQKAHVDFVERLKTRADVERSRVTDEPRGVGHPIEEWRVTYPIDAGIRDGEPAFIWKNAYFNIKQLF